MKGNLESVNCNNCGSDQNHLLYNINGFRIVQCNSCGLVFTNPRVSKENTLKLYDHTYFKSNDSVSSGYDDYLKEQPTIEATFERRIKYIYSHAPEFAQLKDLRALDIGCAMGFLLKLLRSRGWHCDGIELSKFAADYAKDNLNLNVRQGTLNDLELPPDYYNLITSWDVIEHSYNPKEDIQRIYDALKVGGYTAIITPNRDSIHSMLMQSKWVEYQKPEEHLYFFGAKGLSKIMDTIGLKPIAITRAGKYVSIGFALNRLKSYTRLFGYVEHMLGNAITSKYIYINPLDKMFILAKKI